MHIFQNLFNFFKSEQIICRVLNFKVYLSLFNLFCSSLTLSNALYNRELHPTTTPCKGNAPRDGNTPCDNSVSLLRRRPTSLSLSSQISIRAPFSLFVFYFCVCSSKLYNFTHCVPSSS